MNTILLMTDTWQPTVLRLVPFSNNNTRSLDRKGLGTGQMSARNFPVLAVTRTSANSEKRSESKSVTSFRSELVDDISMISETNISEITRKASNLEQASLNKRHRKYAKKKVPETHSELKEAIKFSVQDLNDQVSSSSSLHSTEYKVESVDKVSKSDNTRTKLPKPSMCTSPDARYISPVNGVRRSVALTPGELELQRIRDNQYVEQIQKRKKYKLNINQLPRSTTPINDHDPDKLNMKQVIAFLQTKTSKAIQKKILSEKKDQLSASTRRSQSRCKTSENSSPPSQRVFTKENVNVFSPPNTDSNHGDRSELDSARLNTGCISVMSTKSTPNLPYGNKSAKSTKPTSTLSVRSYKERSRDRKTSRQRPMKEFKLYRFLAIASDGRTESFATSFSDAMPMVEQSLLRTETNVPESPRKMLHRRRELGTAHVLHRHAATRAAVTPPKIESKHVGDEQNKAIRLPLMSDTDHESAEVDSDTCSTTSATCNSADNMSPKSVEDRSKFPKKGKSITFDEKIDLNISLKNKVNDAQNGYSDFPLRNFNAPEFPRVNITGPRHIDVNVPQDDKKSYSQEIVRLTLRQEKNTTRVTSYMSDIQQTPPTKWHEQFSDQYDDSIASDHMTSPTASHMTSSNVSTPQESRDWLDNSKHLIANISNNKFIKVRQRLRATNL